MFGVGWEVGVEVGGWGWRWVMGVGVVVATGLWVKPDVGHDSAEMRRPDQEHRTLSYYGGSNIGYISSPDEGRG